MEVQSAPSSVDETSLLYKLQRKLKVFNTSNNLTNRGYNLLATSTKFGLVFVTSPQGILCEPTHVGTNCDQEWLAVIGGHTLMIFNIPDFQNPNVRPSATIRIDVQPSTFVSSIQWNPCISDTIGIVYFDGTLVVSQVNTMQTKKIQSKARCLCWSPKGKQLVTGNMDGTICQYKPDLTLMKTVPAPNIFENAPHEAMAIHWISTYQFAIVYKKLNDNSRPAVTIVNTPKVGTPICVNFEDICYSLGSNRPWNLILTSSSNSIEIGTLGSKDGATWTQWCQNDEARPELPLTDKNIENYPVGENEVLPPMPFLLVLSHTGLLTVFNIINIDRNASQVCSSIQPLTLPASSLTSTITVPDKVLDTSLVVQSTLIAQAEMNAALKCEQEKINKAKVNQELQNMLIKEVNDFQMELYKFRKFIMENLNETQEEINSMQPNIELHGLSPDQVKQDSEMEELRDFIIQLKLELVRTCAAVAEARTQAESGHRMIHPILDDVYQPLVKQQNILTRHQAVLKTLRNTLKECSTMPFIKTASLFRCTPFKNTIEAQDTKKKGVLSTHKLDALRDFLSNHKPKKIKPVNIELHKHLAQREMQQKYEKKIKQEKLDIVKQHPVTVPATNIKPAVANVVRTLNFTEEPIKEPAENIFVAKPQFKPQAQLPVTKNDSKPAAISDSGNTKVATNDNKNSENVPMRQHQLPRQTFSPQNPSRI
ncbi:unnamed protein product [Leptidea sinapis]|uniref:Nucleoporin Nup159/Nup146 N-terminal domain-containing protein n=1 Tax=Leptidea sinapis TaxID=189913 RepID=A0A5E4QUE4_9NEOP|nr:unnamed protein product [Leptidea sinapis]